MVGICFFKQQRSYDLHVLIALYANVKLMKYKGIFIAPTYFILAIYIPT